MLRHALALLALFAAAAAFAAPVGTQFTYQGRLQDGGAPANGLFDFEFRLHDALLNGNTVGGLLQLNDIPVENGVFSVELDFGAGVFAGQARWLAIGVRPGASTGAYDPLTPRQALTVTPYAQYALSGTPGPQGPQGPSGVLQVATIAASIGNIPGSPNGSSSPWVFTGGFVTLTVQAGQRVTGSGVVSLGHTSTSFMAVETCLCYSADSAGAALTPFSVPPLSNLPATPVVTVVPVTGSLAFPAAGTYRVGACARNRAASGLNISANDWVNAWFMVSN